MINYLLTYVKSLMKDERGQGMVEYGLIIALVALVAAVAFTALGERVDAFIDTITF